MTKVLIDDVDWKKINTLVDLWLMMLPVSEPFNLDELKKIYLEKAMDVYYPNIKIELPREINLHKVNEKDNNINVYDVGSDRKCQHYNITHPTMNQHGAFDLDMFFTTQSEANGVTNETLLAILIDRLEYFQTTQFACDENQVALTACKVAINSLKQRTLDRLQRGVEGKDIK